MILSGTSNLKKCCPLLISSPAIKKQTRVNRNNQKAPNFCLRFKDSLALAKAKSAAKKLIKIAPYKPALGPKPEETPKANANGKATIPAVIPPKASPLKFENKFFMNVIFDLPKVIVSTILKK